MATLTLTIEGAQIGRATVVTTLDKAASDRLTAYLVAVHGTDDAGQPRDLEGMIRAYWAGIAAGTAANVERWERDEAARAARDAVQPLTVTVT